MKTRVLIVAVAGVLTLAGCGSHAVDSGGLTAHDRQAAQRALNVLQNSNISLQLAAITKWVQSAPATCRVHLVSQNPSTFKVYLFWIPWLAAEPYVWLDMRLANDRQRSAFHLGAVYPVLSGGRVKRNGQGIAPGSIDTTLLSLYGTQQAQKGREIQIAHAGDVFAKPGARCQVLKNGSLRLLPNN